MLFETEVAEVFEEWRDGRPMRLPYWHLRDGRGGITYTPENELAKVNPKPEGVPIEMADIFIRILDVCPMWGIDIDHMLELSAKKDADMGVWPGNLTEPPPNVGHALMAITYEFGQLFHSWASGEGLNQIIWRDPEDGRRTTSSVAGAVPYGFPIQLAKILLMLLELCAEWDIEIMKYIHLKHLYNKTRPHRHGGKKA